MFGRLAVSFLQGKRETRRTSLGAGGQSGSCIQAVVVKKQGSMRELARLPGGRVHDEKNSLPCARCFNI
jgi:hypothetical protein